jgi:hypothetical protein
MRNLVTIPDAAKAEGHPVGGWIATVGPDHASDRQARLGPHYRGPCSRPDAGAQCQRGHSSRRHNVCRTCAETGHGYRGPRLPSMALDSGILPEGP